MSKSRKKGVSRRRRRSLFYPIYGTLLVLAVAAIALSLNWLWKMLGDYEKTLPVYVARTVDEMFLAEDYRKIATYEDPALFASESVDDYARYFQSLTADKEITVREARSGDADAKRYVVMAGETKIAEYTLIPTGETSEYGHAYWTLSALETHIVNPLTYAITAPAEATVLVNQTVLGEESIVARDLPVDRMEYIPDTATKRTMVRYEFTRCFGKPDIEVLDERQGLMDLSAESERVYVAAYNYDDDLKLECEERIFEIAKLISRFTSNDLDLDRVLPHLVKDSPAYQAMRGFDNRWFNAHTGYDFADMKSGRYLSVGEDCFVCNVNYDYVIQFRDGTSHNYPASYVFCMQKNGDKWMLYNMVNN